MATNATPAPVIIIRKRKKGHGGHHGGAWKVAYADFVTAMMALFIVLWLLNSNQDVRKAIGGYFLDPTGKLKESGSSVAGSGDALQLRPDDMGKIKQKLENAVKEMPQFKKLKDQIQMSVTGEGLRIELLENERGTFFESGNPKPTEMGHEMLTRLAVELAKLPNRLLIEGHTDSKPYNGVDGYTNWELSADRANAARRLMEGAGLRAGQVLQVRGFADQDLRKADKPEDPSNRRISVIVKYNTAPAQDKGSPKKSGEE